jgi:crotonobetainyl-CoA:carnitine CoA-transferase CaiB-like acyl-CoA transferase
MTGWLEGLRALDLTDERGLLAGQMLAKLGVDVIQVEPPKGSRARRVAPLDDAGGSFYWSAYAAGKRGITLDLDRPEGRELFLKLVETADFLFDNELPEAMAARGLDAATLMARNPRLIHVSITPFGADGPKRDYADAELIVWASGGPLHPSRDTEGPPLRISVPQAYLHGAADAAAGALIAYFARLQTGRGQQVDISVQQSVTQATLGSHLAAAVGHEDFSYLPKPIPMPKKTLDLSGSGARTRRSKWVVRDGLVEMHLAIGTASGNKTNNLFAWMAAENELPDRFKDWDWRLLPERFKSEELGDDDLDDARAEVAKFLSQRSKVELQEAALARKLALAPVNDIGDLLSSTQLRARDFFVTVDEGGASRTLPGRFAYGPVDMFAEPKGAPVLGEDNDAVYGELGLTAALAELVQNGVI